MKVYTPHRYQEEAIQFLLSNPNAGLFLNPGWGKTSIVLAVLLILKRHKKPHRALIVAPPRVCQEVWPHERRKWIDFATGLTIMVLHGSTKGRMLQQAIAEKPDVILVSYDILDWVDRVNLIGQTGRDVLVCDESTQVKNHASKRFKLLRKMIPSFVRRIILTGTPIPNGYEDLWSQMFVVDGGGALGRFITHYRNRYFQNIGHGYNDYRMVEGAEEQINHQIKPLVYRGDAPEVRALLPEITYNAVPVPLPADVRQLYDQLEAEFFSAVGDAKFMPPNAAALSMKLRQVCNGVALSDNDPDRQTVNLHEEKLAALGSIISELNGRPLLVFYEFTRDRDRICDTFKAPFIGGGTTPAEASKLVREFNEGKHAVLCVHPQSAGFGLNLQEACSDVAWFGPTWSAGFWDQGNARVFRQGQKRAVMIHTLVAEGTLDEKVAAVLEAKITTQEGLLAAIRA
jgi:SNF2 family DNA or RNA helicase